MRKKLAAALMALYMILVGVALAEAETQNLLRNPDFEDRDETGYPVGWVRDMWDWDEGISLLSVSEDAWSGESCIEIYNLYDNDARFSQTVAVKPDTYYEIRCRVCAEGCGSQGDGANISIKDTFTSSEQVYDTDGDWVELKLYGKTGAQQSTMTLMARVGGYGALNVGRAWFDQFEMTELQSEPVGVAVYSFDLPENEAGYDDAFGIDEDATRGTPALVAVGLAASLLICAVAWLSGRGRIRLSTDGREQMRLLVGLLVLAFAVRLICAVTLHGYEVDINCFSAWSGRMAALGPADFYEKGYFCDYPPGYLWVLWGIGGLHALFGIGYGSWASLLLIKLVPICMDMCAALFIYYIARRQAGGQTAMLMAAVYALLPAVIINSAAWGQIDSVFTLLLVLAIWQAGERKWLVALPLFGVAVLVKPQTLMFAPLGLAILLIELFRGDAKNALKMLGGVVLMLAAMLLVALPFLTRLDPALTVGAAQIHLGGYTVTLHLNGIPRALIWLISLYGGTMNSYAYLTVNACNLYTLLDMNWTALESAVGLTAFAWAMMALSYVYVLFLAVRGREEGRLYLLCAVLLALVFAFAPQMHERYLFPVLLLLLLAYAKDRDVRLIVAFALAGFTQFVNTGLVYQAGHLQASQQLLNALISFLNLALAGLLAWTGWDLCVARHVIGVTRLYTPGKERRHDSPDSAAAERLFRFRDARLNLKRRDWLIMLALTAVYAVAAFSNLGTTTAPQTQWTSTAGGEQLVFDLGEAKPFHLAYYGGICSSSFEVQVSEDGTVWSEPHWAYYKANEMFRWHWYVPQEKTADGGFNALEDGYPMQTARYIRLTMERAGLILYEVAFLDEAGAPLSIASVYTAGGIEERAGDPKCLIDEQDAVPAYPSYYNSSYFDEIYHARTAYEFQNGLNAYETTHPPLGKVLIMLGIEWFGMTPFGWRFMGTLFGVLMIPAMYLLAKQLLRRTEYAAIAAFLLAVDCMHFTQTRIATIDTYPVFFIMLMYLFMFRYAMMNFNHVRLWRTIVPLGLSGLCMGLAIASKWIGIYGAIGLAVIFFYTLALRAAEYRLARRNMSQFDAEQRRVAQRTVKRFWRNTLITLAWCVVFFIVIPGLIYYYSYYWYMRPHGGLSLQNVWQAQLLMFDYHSGNIGQDHFFASKWYEWPLIVKPMWYYTGTAFMPNGMVSSISCMGNPAVWWFGLAAILFVLGKWIKDAALHIAHVEISTQYVEYKRYPLISVGFLAQYLPWTFVSRGTYIYHYFASVPFIILASVLLLDYIRRRSAFGYRVATWSLCGTALILFAAFYPLISGTPAPLWYVKNLRWFNWYNY